MSSNKNMAIESEMQAASTAVTTSVCYQAHVQNIGWQGTVCNGQTAGTTGQGLRIEAIKIFLQSAPDGVGICYQAHVQNIGWQGEVCNGQTAGTTGQGLRIEAIKIRLTNAHSGMRVSYRAHVQDIGWQGWVYDGQEAGTTGRGLRIEAIEIRIEGGSPSQKVYGESPYIFGIHQNGGEQWMANKDKKGWIVFTEELRNNWSGKDFRQWADAGYGVIVRLNHGYGSNGTLPYQRYYEDFSQRVANYVSNSPGAHIWIIGNETNLPGEWPRYEGGIEEPITADKYADCFRRCRSKIKALPGHQNDQVVTSAVGPWNLELRDKLHLPEGYGWVAYYNDILNQLGPGGVDGMAIHTYTHGSEPSRITSEAKGSYGRPDRYDDFRAYRDFMSGNPDWARPLPVYITETDQINAWADTNSGWVKNAYAEINSWNQNPVNQKIRALVLYRWDSSDTTYNLATRSQVLADFSDAMNNNYRWM